MAEEEVSQERVFGERFTSKHDEILRLIEAGNTMRHMHKALGVSRSSLSSYIHATPDLLEAWNDAQEDILDLNEEIVNEIATTDCSMVETENGSFPRVDGRALASKLNAAKFRLERLGGKRGWNAKIETNEVGNGGRIPMIVVKDVSEEDIAGAESEVSEANAEAEKGLEGVPRG